MVLDKVGKFVVSFLSNDFTIFKFRVDLKYVRDFRANKSFLAIGVKSERIVFQTNSC